MATPATGEKKRPRLTATPGWAPNWGTNVTPQPDQTHPTLPDMIPSLPQPIEDTEDSQRRLLPPPQPIEDTENNQIPSMPPILEHTAERTTVVPAWLTPPDPAPRPRLPSYERINRATRQIKEIADAQPSDPRADTQPRDHAPRETSRRMTDFVIRLVTNKRPLTRSPEPEDDNNRPSSYRAPSDTAHTSASTHSDTFTGPPTNELVKAHTVGVSAGTSASSGTLTGPATNELGMTQTVGAPVGTCDSSGNPTGPVTDALAQTGILAPTGNSTGPVDRHPRLHASSGTSTEPVSDPLTAAPNVHAALATAPQTPTLDTQEPGHSYTLVTYVGRPQGTGRKYIRINIYDIQIPAFIDEGSDISLIDSTLLQTLGLSKYAHQVTERVKILGYTGGAIADQAINPEVTLTGNQRHTRRVLFYIGNCPHIALLFGQRTLQPPHRPPEPRSHDPR